MTVLSLTHVSVAAGYLRKKSRQDRWQRRYFEATTHYLTYYKVRRQPFLKRLEGHTAM